MDHAFDIQQREKGDVLILDLAGSLTVGASEQYLKDTVNELLSQRYDKFVLNLQAVEFMDSSGVGAIVKSYTTVTQNGGKLKLLQPGKMVRHTLKITGLLGIFEVFEDETDAVSSF